jgi:hypothetical protein
MKIAAHTFIPPTYTTSFITTSTATTNTTTVTATATATTTTITTTAPTLSSLYAEPWYGEEQELVRGDEHSRVYENSALESPLYSHEPGGRDDKEGEEGYYADGGDEESSELNLQEDGAAQNSHLEEAWVWAEAAPEMVAMCGTAQSTPRRTMIEYDPPRAGRHR